MIFNTVTFEFKIKIFYGFRLQQLVNEPSIGRIIAVGSLSNHGYITKFMPEAIEADSYFTSGGFTMDVISAGTNDVTPEIVSTIFSSTTETTGSRTYTDLGLSYNQVPGSLLSDVYFQTFDESFSIIENLSGTLTPLLP